MRMENKDYKHLKALMLEAEQADSDDYACIAIFDNKKKTDGFISYTHAAAGDMENLLLRTMRKNIVFTYCVASALEALYEELKINNKK